MGLRRLQWPVNPRSMGSTKRWLAITTDQRKWRGDPAQTGVQSLRGLSQSQRKNVIPNDQHLLQWEKGTPGRPFEFAFSCHSSSSSSRISLPHSRRSCTSRPSSSCAFIVSRSSRWILRSMRTVFCTLNSSNLASVFSTSRLLIRLKAEIPYQ